MWNLKNNTNEYTCVCAYIYIYIYICTQNGRTEMENKLMVAKGRKKEGTN